MADEAGLLRQLGAKLPARKDGKLVAPRGDWGGRGSRRGVEAARGRPAHDAGGSQPADGRALQGRSAPPANLRAPDFKQMRVGFQHLRDYGNAKGVGKETITVSLPDRRDRIDGFIAEGETVWMRFKVAGTQSGKLYGLPPTGRRVEVPEIGIMRIVDGKWKEGLVLRRRARADAAAQCAAHARDLEHQDRRRPLPQPIGKDLGAQ